MINNKIESIEKKIKSILQKKEFDEVEWNNIINQYYNLYREDEKVSSMKEKQN